MATTLPSYPPSCLSESSHGNRISDVNLHFSGCLPISERAAFYDALPQESQQRILRRHNKIALLRQKLESAHAPAHHESKAVAGLRSFKQAMNKWRTSKGKRPLYPDASPRVPSPTSEDTWVAHEDVDADIKAPVIYLKGSQPYNVPGIPNSFPNQKITIKQLLTNDARVNPLMQPCEDGMVRYFHLPANNMLWVEEAIARYYHEERPDAHDFFFSCQLRRSRTKTEMLLRPEFWQGQRNFDRNSEVHARHMRPFCDVISVDPVLAEPLPKNMVLFMPYLHWQTDRGRLLSADSIKQASILKSMTLLEAVSQAQSRSHAHQQEEEEEAENAKKKPMSSKNALGLLLLRAASLLESMEFHVEEQLVYKYLHNDPPLHPRRTLDQSYYGALKSTGARDRDQVVYRGTTPEEHECSFDSSTCSQCAEDIRKVPRLIMVDQLWLWILDEKTIISSFPRRWGKNKPDPTAIHKNLRMRLKYARKDEISSAYDLALMIVDECSHVFFDRTRPNDRQPNMVELFASAIRGVTYKQTAAFDQFLVYTQLAASEYRRNGQVSVATQDTLLNINPEGNLLKEVKDIMDEIQILTKIQEQQQVVMESFVKNIRLALMPRVRRGGMAAGSHVSTSWDALLAATAGSSIGDEVPPAGDDPRLHEYRERQKAKRTLARADHLLQAVQDRKLELRVLWDNAKTTSGALKDLLTLKQQQASVIEARESVEQGRQGLLQGRSIMVFTMVTIIFLPLSFFATLFGMNSIEGNGGNWSLASEYIFMFPLSAGIIFISFLAAFSNAFFNDLTFLLMSTVSFLYKTTITWLAVKTGLYLFGHEMGQKASQLRAKEARLTLTWKAEERRKRGAKLRAAHAAMGEAMRGADRGRSGSTAAPAGARPAPALPFSPYVTSPMTMTVPSAGSRATSPLAMAEWGGPGRRGLGITQRQQSQLQPYDVELGHWEPGVNTSQVNLFPPRGP